MPVQIKRLAAALIVMQVLSLIPAYAADSATPVTTTPAAVTEKAPVTPAVPTTPTTSISFGDTYTSIEGVLNFRGGQYRDNPAFGTVEVKKGTITKAWSFKTGGQGLWGGGSGWTGQPALIKWPQEVKEHMNISASYKKDDKFVEVIQASLNGNVYFFDLNTGKQTRKPIVTGNPIKGSVSVDSRGYPLLYVGQGIKEKAPIGFRIYSLINQKELFYQTGLDPTAPRLWPNFDSSALFEGASDSLFVGGENGLMYRLKLNTTYSKDKSSIGVKPVVSRFNPAPPGSPETKGKKEGKDSRYGIENSLAAYKDLLFFADNGGAIRCVGTDMKLRWKLKNTDDTDASITVDVEGDTPYLYTACEVDWQGTTGNCLVRKINGLTGKVQWSRNFMCYSRFGASPSNGGALATNVMGKGDLDNAVIFTISRCGGFDKGLMVALDKKTGKNLWQWKMPTYAWSSPVAVYNKEGKSYLVQPDHNGSIWMLEGKTGRVLSSVKMDSYFEASAAAFNDHLVLTSRTGTVYGLTLH